MAGTLLSPEKDPAPYGLEWKPISFSEHRFNFTLEYMRDRYNIDHDNIEIEPEIITLHWTEIATLEETWEVFNKEDCTDRPVIAKHGKVNVSSQYIVDRDGKIYLIMPDNWMARHVIGLNYNSIGVENIGGVGMIDDLTEEQIKANVWLVRHLVAKYPNITVLEGHLEYEEMVNTKYWLEVDPDYRTAKVDPGNRFMLRVRDSVIDLGLLSPSDFKEKDLEFLQ